MKCILMNKNTEVLSAEYNEKVAVFTHTLRDDLDLLLAKLGGVVEELYDLLYKYIYITHVTYRRINKLKKYINIVNVKNKGGFIYNA